MRNVEDVFGWGEDDVQFIPKHGDVKSAYIMEKAEERVVIRSVHVLAEDEYGDNMETIVPGEEWHGLTFEQLSEMPIGRIER